MEERGEKKKKKKKDTYDPEQEIIKIIQKKSYMIKGENREKIFW